MKTLASSHQELKKLIANLDVVRTENEAQTRFHIIDKLLRDCLGWDDGDINVEQHQDGQYSDYELGNPRIAILEAKKNGIHFEIPEGRYRDLRVDLESLTRTNNELKNALEQVQQYCSKRGVPIGLVCNGKQLIAFLASRNDGKSVFKANALVFSSLTSLDSNFTLAWQLLSKAAIESKNIVRYLESGELNIPEKASSKLMIYPKVRYASEIQSTLKQLSELLIQDIVENESIEKRFLAECYCESGALSKYSLLSKNILEARYAALFQDNEPHPRVEPVRDKKSSKFSPDILAEALSRRPIVLIGDVGVGKTSFIKNLMHNSAYEEFKEAIYIYIDLGSTAALTNKLKDFILKEIEKQLFEKHSVDIHARNFVKGVYSSEMQRFASGIYGEFKDSNPDLYKLKQIERLEELTKIIDIHTKNSINHIAKNKKKQIIISIDNADQRDFDTQQDAFIISQELAKEWNATVFISVRPQTFYKSKRSGALTAYPHKIFTISPPRIDTVIEKRLKFTLDMAEGKIPLETIKSVQVNAKNLALFIKALLNSLDENPELYEFLTNITGGNIRSVIEFVTGFIGSPNVDAKKIIEIMEEKGRYRIPLHEFTKTALLGDYSHFNPETSIAMNVYDVSKPDKNEHFLIPIILAILASKENTKIDNDGFMQTNEIISSMQNVGFTVDQINSALRKSTNKKLIETSQRITFEEDLNNELIGEMPEKFRITSIGSYHEKKWIGTFTYLDAMVFDTPIFDKSIKDRIEKNIESLSISDRYKRALEFKQYLINCWNDYQSKPSYFNFTEKLEIDKKTFDRVETIINDNKQHVDWEAMSANLPQ